MNRFFLKENLFGLQAISLTLIHQKKQRNPEESVRGGRSYILVKVREAVGKVKLENVDGKKSISSEII